MAGPLPWAWAPPCRRAGKFTLYEDENDNYNYEHGAYATIRLRWNDKALTLEKRTGSYPGMPASRTFQVVLVDAQHGTGLGDETAPARTVPYAGQPVRGQL